MSDQYGVSVTFCDFYMKDLKKWGSVGFVVSVIPSFYPSVILSHSVTLDSGYLVQQNLLTSLNQSFWFFSDVLCIEWRRACGFFMPLQLEKWQGALCVAPVHMTVHPAPNSYQCSSSHTTWQTFPKLTHSTYLSMLLCIKAWICICAFLL